MVTRNSKKAKKRPINNIPTFMDLLWYHMRHAACHMRYFMWHKWNGNSIHHGPWWKTFLKIKCGTLLLLTSLAPSTHWEFSMSRLKVKKKRVLKRSTTRESAFYILWYRSIPKEIECDLVVSCVFSEKSNWRR